MKVIDAGVVVELLVGGLDPDVIGDDEIGVPHLLDSEVLHALRERLLVLSGDGRFDQAALARDRLSGLAAAVDRRQRLRALAAIRELVVARPDEQGGWELTVVRYGRFAAAGHARRGVGEAARHRHPGQPRQAAAERVDVRQVHGQRVRGALAEAERRHR